MHISHDTMLSMALILRSKTVVIKINFSFLSIRFYVIKDYLIWCGRGIYSIRSTYRIFIMFIVSSLYAPKSCRHHFTHIAQHIDPTIIPIKSISIDRSFERTSLKSVSKQKKRKLPFALISFCIQYQITVLKFCSYSAVIHMQWMAKANKKNVSK